jgi:hypothetical protein
VGKGLLNFFCVSKVEKKIPSLGIFNSPFLPELLAFENSLTVVGLASGRERAQLFRRPGLPVGVP